MFYFLPILFKIFSFKIVFIVINMSIYKFLDWTNTGIKNWDCLSMNYNIKAINILENNLDKIDYYFISSNINIFKVDLKFLKQRMDLIRE